MSNFAEEIPDIEPGPLIPIVEIRATIYGENNKNEKEEHIDLTWFD